MSEAVVFNKHPFLVWMGILHQQAMRTAKLEADDIDIRVVVVATTSSSSPSAELTILLKSHVPEQILERLRRDIQSGGASRLWWTAQGTHPPNVRILLTSNTSAIIQAAAAAAVKEIRYHQQGEVGSSSSDHHQWGDFIKSFEEEEEGGPVGRLPHVPRWLKLES